jgi:hypothetical protein
MWKYNEIIWMNLAVDAKKCRYTNTPFREFAKPTPPSIIGKQ